MSTAVAKRDAVTDVCVTINSQDFKNKLASGLADSGLSVERFTRVATTALQLNPDVIVKGSKASVLTSLIRCAQDGLLPDGKEAALVLFGANATYMPMVGGLRKIASGYGFSITANVVHKNDAFEYELGLEPTLSHKPPALDVDRGDPIGAYAVAVGPDGRKYVEVMSRGEIEQVRNVSRAKGSGPWTQWPGEMYRKTVARRLFKSLPLGADDRTVRVLAADDEGFDLAGVTSNPQSVTVDDVFSEDDVFEPSEADIDPEFGA